jgi:hypothetical protein
LKRKLNQSSNTVKERKSSIHQNFQEFLQTRKQMALGFWRNQRREKTQPQNNWVNNCRSRSHLKAVILLSTHTKAGAMYEGRPTLRSTPIPGHSLYV